MRTVEFDSFNAAIDQAAIQLQHRSKLVHSARWQGADISSKPEMATHELTHASFSVSLSDARTVNPDLILSHLRKDIRPNLPWADDHFEERVCGSPINPGREWENWPFAKSASTFLDERGKFNHNYMERYWPKFAGVVKHPTPDYSDHDERLTYLDKQKADQGGISPHRGILYDYGDLNDVIQLLATDPYTRQAYLPMWFPEDTGGGSKRAPCTIGYHFLMRDGLLDINYHIRSCDFVRHFRDDLYLTVRLLLWVIDQAAKRDNRWADVRPGKFIMQIGSLHIFRNDYQMLFGKAK